jgi:hypothetical protein
LTYIFGFELSAFGFEHIAFCFYCWLNYYLLEKRKCYLYFLILNLSGFLNPVRFNILELQSKTIALPLASSKAIVFLLLAFGF